MPIPFIMPKFDMDQEKATIVSWSKAEGERVKAEETVLVVETEKVAIDVPCPATGTLAGIRYQAGDTVPVTTVIAYILKEGETTADLPKDGVPVAPARSQVSSKEALPIPAQIKIAPMEIPPASPAVPAATPVAARIAKENGVDLTQVTAHGDRITREDVEQFIASQKAPAHLEKPAATPAARRLARENDLPLESIQGSGPRGRIQAADVTGATRQPAAVASVKVGTRSAQVVPLTGIRQTIAERMAASFHDIPHISLTVEADATRLESAQSNLTKLAEKDGTGKITVTALLVKIVAWALERNPYINASLIDGKIHLWQDINIGVATAIPDGLIVPVIHQVGQKSIREIALALQDLSLRARESRLALSDVQQGTFTISNLGMFGIRQFRAVINPPESAILAVGAVVRKPVVINDKDEVAVRPIMAITISADHRVIDGVVAARFLSDLVQGIESPESLLY
jgi:pyruvate dehydrogenase E2 component (dihydrolipoamide acetyltransferase)